MELVNKVFPKAVKGQPTPMVPNYMDIAANDEEEEPNPPFKLRSIVGSLQWLAMATRSDIAYPTNAVASSLEKPMKSTYNATKRIVRHLA